MIPADLLHEPWPMRLCLSLRHLWHPAGCCLIIACNCRFGLGRISRYPGQATDSICLLVTQGAQETVLAVGLSVEKSFGCRSGAALRQGHQAPGKQDMAVS